MSELRIDRTTLAREISRNSPFVVNAVKEQLDDIKMMKFTKELLEIAVPVIQANLKNAQNLPTKEGLKQFYDTESVNARMRLQKTRQKARKPLVMKPQQPHLLDLWEVGYKTGKGGHGSIIVSNPKTVSSSNGSFSLLKLLWEGTNRYIVPIPLGAQEKSKIIAIGGRKLFGQYLTRMRENQEKMYADWARIRYQKVGGVVMKTPEQIRTEHMLIKQAGWLPKLKRGEMGEFYKTGGGGGAPRQTSTYVSKTKIGVVIPPEWSEYAAENAPNKMHFYNRFKGKFYYNVFQRKGIEGDVVQDFHDYVAQCILNGLVFAYGEQQEDKIIHAIGQERYA
jgi:hypothetical protein